MMSITKLSLPGPVLVVDDDEKFRDSLTSFLEEQGLQVISVPSAVHACKHMQNQTWTWFPSMIITDIVMDGMGGFEFIRRVQEMYQKRKIPIIVVSKLKGKIDVIEAESAGAIAYV